MTQLRSVTCHMGSHIVTCYPTQVNTPLLNPSHAGRYLIYLPRRDGRLSSPSWLDSAPAGSQTSDLSITSPMLNHCNHQDNQGADVLYCLCYKLLQCYTLSAIPPTTRSITLTEIIRCTRYTWLCGCYWRSNTLMRCQRSDTLMDPCKSNIGGPDPCSVDVCELC